MSSEDMFAPETYADVRQPLRQASTLPPYCYTSQAWYDAELERMWMRNWINIGRVEQIPEPGDYVQVDVIGEPVIMVRDKDRQVRVFSASCRHRGCLVATGEGHVAAFTCPYHGWVYRTNGELIGIPGMREAEGFDPKDYGLVPVKTETWGGFVFINFDPNCQPLMATLGELARRFERHRFDEMQVTRRIVNHVEANWKIWLENSREGYHVPVVHGETLRRFFPGEKGSEWYHAGTPGVYEMLTGSNDAGFYMPRNAPFPMVPGLAEEDTHMTHFVIFYPHLLLNITGSHLAFHQLFPEGPNQTTVITWMCFPKTTTQRPDFEGEVHRYYELPDFFIPEDKAACALVQRGLRARLARPGRFSVEEQPCYGFANWLIDQVVGRDGVEVANREA